MLGSRAFGFHRHRIGGARHLLFDEPVQRL